MGGLINSTYIKVVDFINRKGQFKKDLILNLILRGGGIIISYISLPLILNSFGENVFGIWIALFTTISWLYFFDFGISNAIKTSLTQILSANRLEDARYYITNTYFISILFSTSVLLFFFGLYFIVDFYEFFKIQDISQETFNRVLIILVLLVTLNFTFKIVTQLYLTIHKSWLSAFVDFGAQIISFIFLILFLVLNHFNLVVLALITEGVRLFTYITFTGLFFRNNRSLIPSISRINKKTSSGILKVGFSFLIIQILSLMIYAKDNFLILKTLGASDVTIFNLIFRIYSIAITFFGLFSIPLWTRYTKEFYHGNYSWFKQVFSKLTKVWVIITTGSIATAFFVSPIIELWTGNYYFIDIRLPLSMAFFVSARIFVDIYSIFFYSINQLKGHLWGFLLIASLNIPSTIILLYLNFESYVIPLLHGLFLFPVAIIWMLKAKRLLRTC